MAEADGIERSLDGELALYVRALDGADSNAAVDVVTSLLDDGVDALVVMVRIVAAAQRLIGERWQRGEWSVAREHAATGVSMAATGAIGAFVRSIPLTGGKVVIGCAEREWHALPAMVVNYGLRARGWDVTYLGAATSPTRLAAVLQEVGPDATAVSCSVLSSLPSGRGFIEASTGAGIPVVAGGSAFGSDDVRAMALGATAWASTAFDAIEVIPTLPAVVAPAPSLPAEPLAEQRTMELNHHLLATTLRERWERDHCVAECAPHDAEDVEVVVENVVEQVLHALQVALVTGDDRVIDETIGWTAELLRTRGFPSRLLSGLGGLLLRELHEYPLAAGLVEAHWRVPEPLVP